MKLKYCSLIFCLLLAQCKRDTPTPSAVDTLPPATQLGYHTFGCLVNGQALTPTLQLLSNFYTLVYDPTYAGGSIQIKVQNYTGSTSVKRLRYLTIGVANVTHTGMYPFTIGPTSGVFYTDTGVASPCDTYGTNSITYLQGQMNLTRFDTKNGILSGTFNFKLAQLGCDTLRITDGRFDYTL